MNIMLTGEVMKYKYIFSLFIFFVFSVCTYFVSRSYDIENVKQVYQNNEELKMEKLVIDEEKIGCNIYYPQTKYDVLNNQIKSDIENRVNLIKEKSEYNSKVKMDITYDCKKVTLNKKKYITCVFYKKISQQIVHPNLELFCINYSISDNKIITIDDIIKSDNNLNILKTECENTLLDNDKIKKYNLEKEIKEKVKNDPNIYSTFSFNENELIIYFNEYTVAPYVVGILKVKLNINKLEFNL